AEGRTPVPLQVFASLQGDIPAEAAVFQQAGLRVVIAGTTSGVAQARARLHHCAGMDYLDLGAEPTDLGLLTHILYRDYGVRSLLCEGGPRLYGSMLAAGAVDEEFLTISPIAIGNPAHGTPRPGLVEGVAFDPATVPRSTLVSVRRAGDYLFLRSRYR